MASCCKYDHWNQYKEGRLAKIILCDQLSRACFRGEDKAFKFDNISLLITKSILSNIQCYNQYKYCEKVFILMPLINSENKNDQVTCLAEFLKLKESAMKTKNTEMVGIFSEYLNFV